MDVVVIAAAVVLVVPCTCRDGHINIQPELKMNYLILSIFSIVYIHKM